jgi:hypothetical protein
MFRLWDVLSLEHSEAWDILYLEHFVVGTSLGLGCFVIGIFGSWDLCLGKFCILDVLRLGCLVFGRILRGR